MIGVNQYYMTSFSSLIELSLRRTLQGSVLYSPFTIAHSQL